MIKEYCKYGFQIKFVQIKNIDAKFYALDFYDVNANKFKDFGKIKVGLIKQILMVGFSGILGTGQVEDQKMIKDKLIGGKKL